jgi:hypothetical protein
LPFLIPIIVAAATAIEAGVAAVAAYIGVSTAAVWFTALAGVGSFVLKELLPKPSLGVLSGSNSVTIRQSIAYWQIIYGLVGKLGGVVTFYERSSDNQYDHVIVTLAGHQCTAIDEVYIDGNLVTWSAGGAGAYDSATGKYAGFLWREIELGDPTRTTQPFPQLAAEMPAKWTSAYLQRGRTKIHLKLKLDPNVFPSGVPQMEFTVRGKPVYDPRTATTGYSTNPALCARDWWTDATIGYGATMTSAEDAYVTAAANVCDETVALVAGGTETRYTCNGTFTNDQDPKQVMTGIMLAMVGDFIPVGDQMRMFAGAWIAPTAPTIDEGDFRGEFSFSSLVSRSGVFNAVRGVYVSPDNNYQPSDFPAVTNATYEADDGERIYTDITLPFTNSPSMAQRIAKILLLDQRQAGTATFPLKLNQFDISVPDVIPVSFADLAWSAKNFKTVGVRLAADTGNKNSIVFGVDVDVKETDISIYNWVPAVDEQAPAPGGTASPGDLSSVQPVGILTVASTSTTLTKNIDGIVTARLHITWAAPVDGLVTAGGHIIVEYRITGGTWLTFAKLPGSAVETYIQVDGNFSYDVRVTAQNIAGVNSATVEVDGVAADTTKSAVPSSTLLNPQGSINPQGMTATAAVTGILVSGVPRAHIVVTGGPDYAPDRSTLFTVPNSTTDLATWAGSAVTFSTLYNANVVWDIATGTIEIQQYNGNATTTTRKDAYQDGKSVIVAGINFSTPSTGGTGGGGGGGNPCFTGATRVQLDVGLVRFDQMPREVVIVGDDGKKRNALHVTHGYAGPVILFDPDNPEAGVLPIHVMRHNGKWISADEKYPESQREHFEGTVHNLIVLEHECFDEQSYVLENGDVAHNLKIL